MCFQSDKPDQPSNHIKSLLCTPIGNGKKDKVIGRLLFWFSSLPVSPFLSDPLSLALCLLAAGCSSVWKRAL